MTVESTTSTSIQISWTGSCSKVDKYEVKWERDTTRECCDVNLFNKTIINDSTSYNITELEEDSHYTIIVTANKSGIVVNSSIMEVTPEAGKDTFCGIVNDMKLCPFFPAPSSPPTCVSTTEVTSFSITVLWGPVDCIHRNGDITGYSVRYGVQGSGGTQTVSISGSAVTETTISGLDFSTNYSIEVAAVNNAGIGTYSDPRVFTTEGKV